MLKLRFGLLLIPLLCLGAPAGGQSARQIAQNTFPSVVLLVTEDANGQPLSLGSGFFVRDHVVATNQHVIEGAARGYAKLVGQKKKFDIGGTVGIDPKCDLVLLVVPEAQAPSLSIGDSNQVAVGDEVYAVGNPQGLEGTFSQGIVSSVRQVGLDSLLQITAPVSPGSSGGPVLNTQGKVIGVAVATFSGGQNLNFAIPASYLASLLTRQTPVSPLSGSTGRGQEASILSGLGGRSTEGVVGGKLTWQYEYGQTGSYSFSLRNLLREPVKDVFCLVVFYDHSGDPIDVDVVRYLEVVPAGLAKRVTGRVDGSVQKLTTVLGSASPFTRVEFRVLDFKIVE